jgi:hypothetical protein
MPCWATRVTRALNGIFTFMKTSLMAWASAGDRGRSRPFAVDSGALRHFVAPPANSSTPGHGDHIIYILYFSDSALAEIHAASRGRRHERARPAEGDCNGGNAMNFTTIRKSARRIGIALAVSALALAAGQAQATIFNLNLAGDAANFFSYQIVSGGLKFDGKFLPLTGLDASNAITVSQGDEIVSTVAMSSAYTIPTSVVRTDLLQYFTGSSFPAGDTGVNGSFTFYLAGAVVNTFSYGSSTSNQLASFAAVFPPNNTAFTFDSFSNDLIISNLGAPATLDGAAFNFALVSNAPEPATWAMMLAGFGALGLAGYRRGRRAALAA